MLNAYGIAGAAIAWVLRMAVDAVFLFVLANRILSTKSPFTSRPVLMVSIALLTIGICGVVPGLAMKGSFLLVVLILFVISAWFVILETDDKNRIRNHLRKIHISS
jgi:hypothetical protein